MKTITCACYLLLGIVLSPLAQAAWVDISPSVEISQTKQTLDRVSKGLYSYVKVKNSSGAEIAGPLHLKIMNPTVPVANAEGLAEDFQGYFILNDGLAAGAVKTVRVNFPQSRNIITFGVQLAKEGFVVQTQAGDTYNPPAEARFVTTPKAGETGLFIPYVDGSFIVWFKDGITTEQVNAVAARIKASVQGHIAGTQQYMLLVSKQGLNFSQMSTLLAQLREFSEVEIALIDEVSKTDSSSSGQAPDFGGYSANSPNPFFPDSINQYYMDSAGILDTWKVIFDKQGWVGGTEKRIGVIDNALVANHEDIDIYNLAGKCYDYHHLNCASEIDKSTRSVINLAPELTGNEKNNMSYHGTHVTGIISAESNHSGVSGIMPYAKVLFSRGRVGGFISNGDMFVWQKQLLEQYSVNILNMSLGDPVRTITLTNQAIIPGKFCIYIKKYHEETGQIEWWLQEKNFSQQDCRYLGEDNSNYSPLRFKTIPFNLQDAVFNIGKYPFLWVHYSDLINLLQNIDKLYSVSDTKAGMLKFYKTLLLDRNDRLLINSSGNENSDSVINRFSICSFPENLSYRNNSLCVAALKKNVTPSEAPVLWEQSNYGPVDIATYGEDIYSTIPTDTNGDKYAVHSGTSMAAPIITGIAGLIWNAYPTLTAAQVRESIVKGIGKAGAVTKTECATTPDEGEYVTHPADPTHKIPVANAYCALIYAKKLAYKDLAKKTSQVSYTSYDDGYYQSGVTPSYTRYVAQETVTDNITGLIWQDNVDAKTVLSDWQGAKNYCSNSTLAGYSDWRLPNIRELKNITDYSKGFPDINNNWIYAIDQSFQNISGVYYSSTPHSSSSTGYTVANAIDSKTGMVALYASGNQLNVRCVRGDETSPHDLQRDDTKGIVTDLTTQLQWQDDTVINGKNFSEAINYCENLALGGHDDWRLPNIAELSSIVDYSKYTPAMSDIFKNATGSVYRSSSKFLSKGSTWLKDFRFNVDYDDEHFTVADGYPPDYIHVRCVRSGYIKQ